MTYNMTTGRAVLEPSLDIQHKALAVYVNSEGIKMRYSFRKSTPTCHWVADVNCSNR